MAEHPSAPSESSIYIVRQPIFDRADAAVGYELRFRDADGEGDPFARAYLGGAFDTLRAGLPAWIRANRRQLAERIFGAADPKSVVVLLPPDLPADEESLAEVSVLAATGVTIGLDEWDESDPGHAARLPFLDHASFARLDLRMHDAASLVAATEKLRASKKRIVADMVQDGQSHRLCMGLGIDMFQGPRFSRPEPLPAAELPASTATALRLLSLARDPDTPDRDLERAVSADPSLTFQLLRLVNSAAMGGRGIQSIGHAIRLVGRSAFVRWLALAFAASRAGNSGVDHELTRQAVQRGRLCEMLAGQGRDRGTLFLVGLFSLIDAVFRMPLAEVLDRVRLAEEVHEALLDRVGPYADALNLVESYELGLWESAAEQAGALGVDAAKLPGMYAEALAWATEQIPTAGDAKVKKAS